MCDLRGLLQPLTSTLAILPLLDQMQVKCRKYFFPALRRSISKIASTSVAYTALDMLSSYFVDNGMHVSKLINWQMSDLDLVTSGQEAMSIFP